jgi:hypothetical protein
MKTIMYEQLDKSWVDIKNVILKMNTYHSLDQQFGGSNYKFALKSCRNHMLVSIQIQMISFYYTSLDGTVETAI